jgi:putative alpha-1,2-mannosidase
LFAGECYYPGGGASDYIADFHNLIDAQIYTCRHVDWSHILDTETGEIHETDNKGEWVVKPLKEWIV